MKKFLTLSAFAIVLGACSLQLFAAPILKCSTCDTRYENCELKGGSPSWCAARWEQCHLTCTY